MISHEYAIIAENIRKNYTHTGSQIGLNGFTLYVPKGMIYGLLGPNGAGKTTAIKILTTLLEPDSGQASVAGFDIRQQSHLVRQHIGMVSQYASIDEILTGRQNLLLFGQLYHFSKKQAARRADELLEQFDLQEASTRIVSSYSGGMRRRLDLAASLIIAPKVLFVDEPTTGLDPASRREVWATIQSLAQNGTTILLTTQYLEEADQLAERIAILKQGRVIAEGKPEQLKAMFGSDWIDIIVSSDQERNQVIEIVRQFASGDIHADDLSQRVSVPIAERTSGLIRIATALSSAQIATRDITLRRPTLDEVFIHLTKLEHHEEEQNI